MKKESGSAGEERTGEEVIWGPSFLGERREKRKRQRGREREVFQFCLLNRERGRFGKMNKKRE